MTELDFIEELLGELAETVRERYSNRGDLEVHAKSDPNDLLTEVDLEVQTRAERRLASAFPDDHFVSEEAGLDKHPEDARSRCWIMDPIDGTSNFVRGLFPAFGISLAFATEGEVVAGGVAIPMTGDLFLAERGAGARRNGTPTRVSDVASVNEARVEIDFGYPEVREATLKAVPDLILRAGGVRCHAAAVIGLCAIAAGEMDAYVHVALKPWDFAAGQLIVEEAGGRSSRLDGTRLTPLEGTAGVLASNGLVHDELVSLLVHERR